MTRLSHNNKSIFTNYVIGVYRTDGFSHGIYHNNGIYTNTGVERSDVKKLIRFITSITHSTLRGGGVLCGLRPLHLSISYNIHGSKACQSRVMSSITSSK